MDFLFALKDDTEDHDRWIIIAVTVTVQEFPPTTAELDSVRNEPSTSSEINEENEMANDDDREADSSKAPIPDSNNAFSDTSKGGQKLSRSLFPS